MTKINTWYELYIKYTKGIPLRKNNLYTELKLKIFREEIIRELKLRKIDRSSPTVAFFKFYGWFKSKHEARNLKVAEWREIFFDVLKRVPPSSSNIRPVNEKAELRLIIGGEERQKPISRVRSIVAGAPGRARAMERLNPDP